MIEGSRGGILESDRLDSSMIICGLTIRWVKAFEDEFGVVWYITIEGD